MNTRLLILFFSVIWPVAGMAQDCDPDIKLTAPQSRFLINQNGTVADNWTGLTWMRCPLNTYLDDRGTSTFSDDKCVAEFTYMQTWSASLSAAYDANNSGGYAGSAAWRLPNIKELSSLVERACNKPAINKFVFPDANAYFWSSSSVAQVTFSSEGEYGYLVNFVDGKIVTTRKAQSLGAARLVQGP